ncbi:MAG: hypothetical protein NTU94_13820 [Planctomycetota bacterium]|nr:hypothetical protein [Planctomycetota bacterium]
MRLIRAAQTLAAPVALWIGLVAAGAAAGEAAEATTSINAPARTIAGLTFDGKRLWCADRASRTLFALETATGKVLKRLPLPGPHAAGLDWDDGFLWHVDGRTRKVYRLSAADGKVVAELPAPGGDPPGIVRVKDTLLVGDWNDGVVYTLAVGDGRVLKTQWSPLAHPWGMATDGRRVWFANGESAEAVVVDLERWQAITGVPLPTRQPTGIALDGDALWVAGMGEDRIWRLPIGGGRTRHVVRREVRRHVRVVTEVNDGAETMPEMRCCLVLPVDKPGQRIVGAIQFQPEPLKVEVDERGQRVAHYVAKNVPPGGWFQASWAAEVEFEVFRWAVFPEQAGRLEDVPRAIRETYTAKAKRYDLDHPAVRLAAREAVGGETQLYGQVRAIHDDVLRRLRYTTPGWQPAATGVLKGIGICDDYSSVFVGMCRATGIPARVMIGSNHVSAEVYFPGIAAWFPIDLTADDRDGAALWLRMAAFGLSDRLITHIENDAEPDFWKPKDAAGRTAPHVSEHVGERIVARGEPPGPVFSGILKVHDAGASGPVVLEWPPAYDPDGNLPVRYEVCLVPSTAAVGAVAPALTTQETRSELKDLKSGQTYYVRVVPVNSQGKRFAAALRDVGLVREIGKR